MKIAVYGASGNIGSRVVRRLAAAGHTPVALLHNTAKQSALPEGVEVRAVKLPDASGLAAALREVDALLWLTAPNTQVESVQGWYAQCTEALEVALRQSPVQRIVHISSIGAGSKQGLSTVTYVGDVELHLNSMVRNVVHLRPGYFMQNLLMNIPQIAAAGVLALPFAADHDMPWISATDIADAAVQYLTGATWTGQWYRNLMGPCNLTGQEVAQRLSGALGRPVRFETVAAEHQRAMLSSFGLNAAVVDDLMALFAALGDLDGVYATARTHEAATPTTMDEFLRTEFLPLLSQAPASR